MAALAERRIIPHEELKARAEEKSEAEARPEHMRLLEALLFAAAVPLDEKILGSRLPEDVDLKAALYALQAEYSVRENPRPAPHSPGPLTPYISVDAGAEASVEAPQTPDTPLWRR